MNLVRRITRSDFPLHILILFILGLELLPMYLMIEVSFKDNRDFIANPWLPLPPSEWKWENYQFAFRTILPALANTVFVAVLVTFGRLVLAVCGAYFFARKKVPGQRILWALFLLLMLIPGVTNLVPLFLLLRELSLLNTLWALVILGISGGQVFAIFVLKHFLEDLPKDLFDAAEIDGAGHFAQIRVVVLPLCGSIIGTLAILTFLSTWNDYLMPFIVLRDEELYTLGVQLIYLDGEQVKHWGRIMAAYTTAAIPLLVIFVFLLRLFVRGLSAGAIKG
jgi:multiple sugar transport system permease protein